MYTHYSNQQVMWSYQCFHHFSFTRLYLQADIKNFCINSCHHFVTVTHELLLWAYFQHWGHTAVESRATFSSQHMAGFHLCTAGSSKGSQAGAWPSHLVRTVRMFFPYIQRCLYVKKWVTHAAIKAPHSCAPCTAFLAWLFEEVDFNLTFILQLFCLLIRLKSCN